MDKKEQIIQAAMQLLTDNGVQATPMSAIAKAAGTGMGTIYNYFATKEELINAIYIYIKQEEIAGMALPFNDDSLKRQFDHYFSALILYFIKHPLHFRFMDQFSTSPIITDNTQAEGLRAMAPFIALIARGQEQGVFKQISFDELVQFLNSGLMGFVRWVLDRGTPMTQTMLDNQLRIAWDAIRQ